MVKYLGWLTNTMLFVLCCFLVADTANAIIAALLAEPAPALATAKPEPGSTASSWEERQVIVRRNLFHSSDLTPKPPEPEPIPDILEETELPLKLKGTIASENPDLALAVIEELDSRSKESKTFQVGESIQGAELLAIERGRVVLLEKGVRRSLSLDEDDDPLASFGRSIRPSVRSARTSSRARRSTPSSSSRTRRSARKSMADRVKQLAADRFEVEPDAVQDALNNPASLYTQARILPKIGENGEFSGIEISAIKPGSVFEQVGIEDGDVITAIGGEKISDVGQSSGLLSSLTDGESIELTILTPDGEKVIHFQFPPQ